MKKNKEYYLKKQKEAQERLDSGESLVANYLPQDASTSDRIKYNICQNICEIHNSGITLVELSKVINCDIITVKLIVYSHYDKFTLDYLVNAYEEIIKSGIIKSDGSVNLIPTEKKSVSND